MTQTQYEQLLTCIGPHIAKSSKIRERIGPSERLSVTLKYLASGQSQIGIAFAYRISPSAVTIIISETCPVIWENILQQGYLKAPAKIEEWKSIAYNFEKRWNFHYCLGAIDGKRVVMQAPHRSGSFYFNYKNAHSIVLMAISNANYEFILVDIGDTGRNSDGGVLANSDISEVILGEKIFLIFQNLMLYWTLVNIFHILLWAMKHYPIELI